MRKLAMSSRALSTVRNIGQGARKSKKPLLSSANRFGGGGALAGGTAGGIGVELLDRSVSDEEREAWKKENGGPGRVSPKTGKKIMMALGILGGAAGGRHIGLSVLKDLKTGPVKPSWLRAAKTKADAKKAYRGEMRKSHPDLGGSTAKAQATNAEWAQWQSKFASVRMGGFASELVGLWSR